MQIIQESQCKIAASGTKWFIHDDRHPSEGLTIEWTRGDKTWYINGIILTESEFNEQMHNEINNI